MVGYFTSGTMFDNQEQGIDGATISLCPLLSPLRCPCPNVVLLHAGTNDMNLDLNVSSAPARLSCLIDQIFGGCPDAAVVVAKIIASPNATTNARIGPYNEAVGEIVGMRKSKGQHVQIVDMQNALPPDQYNDTLHPNNEAYATMASLWYEGIVEVNELRWIGIPVTVGNQTTETSAK
jgi:lysophospholipase L1-like esterase